MNEGERFWESIYEKASPASNGEPSAALVRFAKELSPVERWTSGVHAAMTRCGSRGGGGAWSGSTFQRGC